MNLSDWANIATIVQAVLVPVSIGISTYFVLKQIQETRRLASAANTEKLVELTSPFHLQLIQDPETARLWVKGAAEWNTLDEVDQERYSTLLSFWLIFHENIYHQEQQGLLDEVTLTTWKNDLKYFIKKQHLERRWPKMQEFYEPTFVKYIGTLINGQETKNPRYR
jgi:hypothetical protein